MSGQEPLFPIFLKLAGRQVLVVGGGPVATSKIGPLLAAGARVRVVAPELTETIRELPVTVRRRPYRTADLEGAWLVVAAATPDVNRQVAEDAEARQVFVNAVDDIANASAYLGGVVRRAGVTFAISTDGRAPALAGILREGLDAVLPEDDLESWVDEAARQRERWKTEQVPMEARRPRLLQALWDRYRYDVDP